MQTTVARQAGDSAGRLLFLARTCVQESVGDSCGPGTKDGRAVTVGYNLPLVGSLPS